MRPRPRRLPEPTLWQLVNVAAVGVPLLLIGAQFPELGVLDAPLPAIRTASASAKADPSFDLAVRVTGRGYEVSGPASTTIPCLREGCATALDYDTAGLTRVLASVKGYHPYEDRVLLVPEGDIAYEVLIATMDAARADHGRALFGQVVVSGAAP